MSRTGRLRDLNKPLFVPRDGVMVPPAECPGIYVEEAEPGESLPSLTGPELLQVARIMHGVAWHRTGFGVGRVHGDASFCCDSCDMVAVLNLSAWRLGDDTPADPGPALTPRPRPRAWRRWAVEFPAPPGHPGHDAGYYVRRGFWAFTAGDVRAALELESQMQEQRRRDAAAYRNRRRAP
jgi:hypothetical protein